MSRTVPVPPAVALALVLAGCPDNVEDPFPKAVGYQPLTYCPQVEVADPQNPSDRFPEMLNILAAPGCGGALTPDKYVVTSHAHARGFLKVPILTVWAKMQPTQDGLPNWVHLCDDGTDKCVESWHWLPGTETADFPVSFRMKYHVDSLVSVDWEHTWRQGLLEGTVAAPLAVGARYQKTWGIENIRVQTGSFVLRPVGPVTGAEYTSIELVAWLDADTQGQSETEAVFGSLVNAYNLLKTGVYTP
jgi:hypothetical protein